MKQIWKWDLSMALLGKEVFAPKGAELLTAQMQGDTICVWMKVDPDNPKEPRTFVVVGTGHGFDDAGLSYCSSVQDGEYVWHIFERVG